MFQRKEAKIQTEINKYIQQMPEEEREVLAVWLISKAIEEKESGVWREKVTAKKLSEIMSIANKNKKLSQYL
jgi:hypothetical protein